MRFLTVAIIFLAANLGFAESGEGKKARRAPSSAESFKVHACEKVALQRADQLLRFHYTDGGTYGAGEQVNIGLDDKVVLRAPLKAPGGKGKYDVLEVSGFIDKAEYRMRFIFAPIKGTCALMGQEILEMSNI